eukprot:scaffold14742_cov142-Skeletonema_marinoi.AAC.3
MSNNYGLAVMHDARDATTSTSNLLLARFKASLVSFLEFEPVCRTLVSRLIWMGRSFVFENFFPNKSFPIHANGKDRSTLLVLCTDRGRDLGS